MATTIAALPCDLLGVLFSNLRFADRLVCRAVCKRWHELLKESVYWRELDVSAAALRVRPAVGSWRHVDLSFLAHACSLSSTQLDTLDLSGYDLTFDYGGASSSLTLKCTELAALVVQLPSLRKLSIDWLADAHEDSEDDELSPVPGRPKPAFLSGLLAAGPQLRELHCSANVLADVESCLTLLRREPPFAVVQLQNAFVWFDPHADPAESHALVRAVCAAFPSQTSLRGLELGNSQLNAPGLLAHVVDCVIAAKLPGLRLATCTLPEDDDVTAAELARLLRGGLACFSMQHGLSMRTFSATNVVGSALGASRTLTVLRLMANLHYVPASTSGQEDGVKDGFATADALLAPLIGHPTLVELDLELGLIDNSIDSILRIRFLPHRVGRLLARIVAADAPCLTSLSVRNTELGDFSAPLMEALACNTHLRTLDLQHTGASDALLKSVLLPALRRNTGLRQLRLCGDPDILRAVDAVLARRQGGAAPPALRRSARKAVASGLAPPRRRSETRQAA